MICGREKSRWRCGECDRRRRRREQGRLGEYMWVHTLVRRMPSDDGCCFLFGAFGSVQQQQTKTENAFWRSINKKPPLIGIYYPLDTLLTWPFSSSWLLVSFSLSKDTICFIQLAPAAGESGCTWILGGDMASALPATTQQELQHKKIQGKVNIRERQRESERIDGSYL